MYFRDGRKGFGERAAVASRSTMVPCKLFLFIQINYVKLFT